MDETHTILACGAGAVTLNVANTHLGGTELNQGTIVVGHAQALGSGLLTMAGGTTLGFNGDHTIANDMTLKGNVAINVDAGENAASTGAVTDGTVGSTAGLSKTGEGSYTVGELRRIIKEKGRKSTLTRFKKELTRIQVI